MKFVLRDDDTCAITTPHDIEACYQGIWQEIPISLSVTPFRIPGAYHFVPEPYFGSTRPIALDANKELVSFLREAVTNGLIDVAIHGYHHAVYDGKPEYVAGPDLIEKTAHARRYLIDLIGKDIVTFVPPHNSIGKLGLRGVINAGLNLVNIPSLWSWKVRRPSLHAYTAMPRVYSHTKLRKRSFPYVLDFQDHKEVSYHTAGPGSRLKELFAELDYCHDQGGVFVLATHYHAFNLQTASGGTVGQLVYDLLNRAKTKSGTSFVRISDIW